MDKLTTREKKFIIGGTIFLVSVILFLNNFKDLNNINSTNVSINSLILGVGIFAILFPWIDFRINKRVFLKLAISLFILRIGSFGLLLHYFGLIAISFFATWIIFIIFNYVKSLSKPLGLKILYFILITFISWLYYSYVPVIIWGVLFGLD